MLTLSFGRLWLVVALLSASALPALAQGLKPPDDSPVSFGGMLAKKPQPRAAPEVAAPPMAWPRLDRGSVLCRTEDDLARRAAMMRGEQAGPADCRPVIAPMAIQIVHRAGPGSTEVRVTSSNETGWTDAWLPAAPPRGTTPAGTGQTPTANPGRR